LLTAGEATIFSKAIQAYTSTAVKVCRRRENLRAQANASMPASSKHFTGQYIVWRNGDRLFMVERTLLQRRSAVDVTASGYIATCYNVDLA